MCDGCGRRYRKRDVEKLYVLLVQSKLWQPEPEYQEHVFCSQKCIEDFLHKRRV